MKSEFAAAQRAVANLARAQQEAARATNRLVGALHPQMGHSYNSPAGELIEAVDDVGGAIVSAEIALKALIRDAKSRS